MPSVGGGFTNHGLEGTYYSDPNFTNAAFSRRDVRIDFNWDTTVRPGGSLSPGFRDVGTDNFSARWTGQLIARFSETYTFTGTADDTFRLEIKPAGAGTWTTVVNKTQTGNMSFAGFYAFQAGHAYDVRLSFQEFTGAAALRLLWSSPSTPAEVIDPLDQPGFHIQNQESTTAFADIVKGARNTWVGGAPTDANGWPMGDASYYFQESINTGLGLDPLMRGTIRFSFLGRATVGTQGNVETGSLTYAYDAATNTTTGSFRTADRNANATAISFANTTRNGQTGGPGGITNLRMLRPTAPDATTTYSAGTIFTTHIKDYAENYTVIRFQLVANEQRNWSDRTLPTFFNQSNGQKTTGPHELWGSYHTSDNLWSWEYAVMLANETGSDLMLSIPTMATGRTAADVNSYVVKLANLIRYGSDGVNPYTVPTANPVYPPLNPNLRVYLELENELWNWASVFYYDYNNLNQLVRNSVLANDADFQAINYDALSLATNANGEHVSLDTWRFRYIMLRMKQISDIFRSVFGDAAMPGTGSQPDVRVRPLYEWQYNNTNDTARKALTWADRYYNKTDPASTYAGAATPVNAYLWGGGGATYYSANNPNGLTTLLPNPGFDATTVANGYTQSAAGAGWTFTGTAGIARDAGTGDDIPAPFNGSQVGYISGTGRITSTFTVPATQTSNQYGVSFKAHNRRATGAAAADTQNLRVYLDYGTPNQIDITAKSFNQTNGYVAPDIGSITPWAARNVFWSESQYYYTRAVALTPGSTHTVTIVGTGAAGQIAFLEDVRVTSVDAIFAGGMPGGGEATGQPAGSNIRTSMNGAVSWAAAYGLTHVAYEGGWSLGGDDGGSFIQLRAKYGDARTGGVQSTFMDYYDQAGGEVNVFGTYVQIPNWADYYAEQGLINSASYPIIAGILERGNRLGVSPTNGTTVPSVLTNLNVTLGDRAETNTARVTSTGGWLTWNIIVPRTGTYSVRTTTGTGGSLTVLADERSLVSGTSGGNLNASVTLTAGLHVIKVRSTAGAFAVQSVTVTSDGAPATPTISSLTSRNDSAMLTWNSVPNAAGYFVQVGTTPGVYTQRFDIVGSTSYTMNGLLNNTNYYFAVASYSTTFAESLPSAPRSIGVLVEGLTGRLANWDFTGLVSNGATVPATAPVSGASGGLIVSPLTRGAGLMPSSGWVTQYNPDRFASDPVGFAWAQSLAAAITQNQYYQFSVTANAGVSYSLADLGLQVWFSDSGNANNRVTVQYSLNGSAYQTLTTTGTINSAAGITAALGGIPTMQNFSGIASFRIFTYGAGSYSATGIGLGTPAEDLVVRGSVRSTPAVEGVVIGDGTTQRSSINRLQVAFNTFVTLGSTAFSVTPQAGGAAIPITWTTADVNGRTVATISFQAGTIADGLWRLTTNAVAVTHRAGGPVMATNRADNYHRLYGDFNGDRAVNGTDLFNLRPTLGVALGQPGFQGAFDYNLDGVVNGTDFFQFRSRNGTTI